MKGIRRMLSFALALCMVISMVPVGAFAEETAETDPVSEEIVEETEATVAAEVTEVTEATEATEETESTESTEATEPVTEETETVTEEAVAEAAQEENLVASGTCGEAVYWKLDSDGLLTIYGEGEMKDYQFDTDFAAPWDDYRETIKSVAIEDGVTRIGDFAFYYCSLENITLPDSLLEIGFGAFMLCPDLKEIILPDSVTSIEEMVFLQCSSLSEAVLSENMTSIGWTTFGRCENLKKLVIPASVTDIGDGAFSGCSKLTEVFFNGDAPSMGSSIFYGVTATAYYPADNATWTSDVMQDYGGTITWEAVKAHEHTEVIDEAVEATCVNPGLTQGSHCETCGEILIAQEEIPATGTHTFVDSVCTGCGILGGKCGESVYWTLDDAGLLTVYGVGAMEDYGPDNSPWNQYDTSVKTVNIETGVTSIGHYAFHGCTATESVTIADTVSAIGYDAFYGCESLTSIEIPYGVKAIENATFRLCKALTDVAIPESVTIIEEGAFSNCASLEDIVIPNSVTCIETGAFIRCTALRSIEIPASVTTYGESIFERCTALTRVVLPENITEIPFGMFFECNSLSSINIPESVTAIGDYAFQRCWGLTEIELHGNLVTIGEYAFWNCNMLEEIVIPDCVTTIGRAAFQGCKSLAKISLSENLSSIGNAVFESCSIEEIVIPEGVESIEEGAFAYTLLQKITFEGDCPAISADAFSDVVAVAYYPADNATWTSNVMQDYGGTITWVAMAAQVGDSIYGSLAEALTNAQSGDVVMLMDNVETNLVLISPGITLDLNGHSLQTDFAVIYKGGEVKDTSVANSGKIAVEPDCIVFGGTMDQLPVWTGDGYIFVEVLGFQEVLRDKGGKPQYLFLPQIEEAAHPYLAAGAESSKVKVAIRMTWTLESGTAFQNYVYNDEFVTQVINSYADGRYSKVFSAIINKSEQTDFAICAVLISDTGVEMVLPN